MKRVALAAAMLLGCRDEAPRPGPAPEVAPAPPGKVELIEAGEGTDVVSVVAREHARAQADRAPLVVYVGASWCEPCVRFHAAAASGQLDAIFPSLRVVVFDADRDDEALIAGGYGSKMIPLFAVPLADGRASPRRTEGGIPGERAVAQLTPRLRALLAP